MAQEWVGESAGNRKVFQDSSTTGQRGVRPLKADAPSTAGALELWAVALWAHSLSGYRIKYNGIL